MILFCNFGIFTCNYRWLECVKFLMCKCLVNFVVNFVVFRKRISAASDGFPVLSTSIITADFPLPLDFLSPPVSEQKFGNK